MATKTRKTKAAKPAPVEETPEDEDFEVVDEDEDVELEELDADAEESDGKAKKASKLPEVKFGVADLAAYLSKKVNRDVSTRELRTLIRKMAREDTPRVTREIVPGNRTRYDWGDQGINHPEVQAIIAAVTGGEMEADKKEKLAKLKEDKAKKAAAKSKTTKTKKGRRKAAPEPEPVEDDDVEEIDLDDDQDDD